VAGNVLLKTMACLEFNCLPHGQISTKPEIWRLFYKYCLMYRLLKKNGSGKLGSSRQFHRCLESRAIPNRLHIQSGWVAFYLLDMSDQRLKARIITDEAGRFQGRDPGISREWVAHKGGKSLPNNAGKAAQIPTMVSKRRRLYSG